MYFILKRGRRPAKASCNSAWTLHLYSKVPSKPIVYYIIKRPPRSLRRCGVCVLQHNSGRASYLLDLIVLPVPYPNSERGRKLDCRTCCLWPRSRANTASGTVQIGPQARQGSNHAEPQQRQRPQQRGRRQRLRQGGRVTTGQGGPSDRAGGAERSDPVCCPRPDRGGPRPGRSGAQWGQDSQRSVPRLSCSAKSCEGRPCRCPLQPSRFSRLHC